MIFSHVHLMRIHVVVLHLNQSLAPRMVIALLWKYVCPIPIRLGCFAFQKHPVRKACRPVPLFMIAHIIERSTNNLNSLGNHNSTSIMANRKKKQTLANGKLLDKAKNWFRRSRSELGAK